MAIQALYKRYIDLEGLCLRGMEHFWVNGLDLSVRVSSLIK